MNNIHTQMPKSANLELLRDIGKSLHVKAPTSLHKNELIKEIGKFSHKNKTIIIGDIWGKNQNNNVATLINFENLNQDIRNSLKQELINSEDFYEFDKLTAVEDVGCSLEYKTIDTTLYSRTSLSTSVTPYTIVNEKNEPQIPSTHDLRKNHGYVDVENGKWVIKYLGFDRQIELSDAQVQNYKFARFDNVTFTAFYSLSTKQNFLLDVIEKNGVNYIHNSKEQQFENLVAKPPQNAHKFDNYSSCFVNLLTKITPILEGSRVLVAGEDKAVNNKIMQELTTTFTKNDIDVFPIYIDCINEDEELITRINYNTVFAGFSDDPENKMGKILLSYFRAQRLVEMGQKAVIIINDFSLIYDLIEALITTENKNYLTTIATKFFNVGARRDNDGALTVITFIDQENLRLYERLKRASSLFVPLRNDTTVYPPIDILKVENKLENFYMDDEAKTVANDIKQLVESKEMFEIEPIIKDLANLKGADRKTIIGCIKNL